METIHNSGSNSGAIYHIRSRGDRRATTIREANITLGKPTRGGLGEPTFFDDVDRQDFIKTLAEPCAKTDFQVHAFCLMSNHFHLVLETPQANLGAGMQWLLSSYTLRLNRRRALVGHVFSGRYKALLVDGSGNGYLKTVCDYVHLNPARAGLLQRDERLLSYPWSSLPWYFTAPAHRPSWMRVDRPPRRARHSSGQPERTVGIRAAHGSASAGRGRRCRMGSGRIRFVPGE